MADVPQRLGYVPGLDGVRALAVVAVVAFHAGSGWASGGFLGVSVFFTLSGYLITSLLLAEHGADGRVSLLGFYGRRARRLLPASLACCAMVVAAWPWWSDTQVQRLPGDVLAALAQVANWRAAFGGASYRDLFGAEASPLTHFWSLAIEEQLYLVLPVIVVGGLRLGRRRLTAMLAGFAVASAAALALTDDFDLAYNGTHTRAAEVLVGALAAVVVRRRVAAGDAASVATPPGVQVVAAVALVGLGVAVATVSLDDAWLLRGGFTAVSVASVALVLGASGGPLGKVLGWRPLVAIGRRSYGIYLFHWPVLVLLTPERVGVGGWQLDLLRLAVVAVLVEASYRWLEQPIRHRRRLRSPRLAGAAFGGAAGAVLVTVAVLPEPALSRTEQVLTDASSPVVTFGPLDPWSTTTTRVDAADDTSASSVPAEGPGSTDAPRGPVRVLVIGDSTSLIVATALDEVADGRLQVVWAGEEGCPFVRVEATRAASNLDWVVRECAGPMAAVLDPLLELYAPDAVVLVAGAMAMMEHRYPGDPRGHLPGSAEYVARHDADMATLLELLEPTGTPVVVADAPPLGVGSYSTFEMADRARAEAWNAQIRRWDLAHEEVTVWPYADAIVAYEAEFGNIRLDGSHPEIEPLVAITRDTLFARLERILAEVVPAGL